MDSNFPYVESLLIKLLADPSRKKMDFDWLLNGPAIGFQVAYCHVRQPCMYTTYSALPHLQNNMPLIKRVQNSIRM